jgi:endoglucanase
MRIKKGGLIFQAILAKLRLRGVCMRKLLIIMVLCLPVLLFLAPACPSNPNKLHQQWSPKDNLFEKHGKLSVKGADLVDKNGEKVQLYGMSTHGIAWFPKYVDKEAFKTLRDDWNTNCIRIAMYTAESGGYCTTGNKENLKTLVKNGVDWATELGMYAIIDWHILNDNRSDSSRNGDPNHFIDEAKLFFAEMSKLYKDRDNILYEICNEPNGSDVTWDDVKKYANVIIPIIRGNDPDAIILVGTPTWSQDIDKASQSPLTYDNIMYSLHFYAATHKDYLRKRLDDCVSKGLPVFVNEFAICDASGNGANDFESGKLWFGLIKKHNLSYMAWNLANKRESSSVFVSNSSKISDWTDSDLTEWGKWIRGVFRAP